MPVNEAAGVPSIVVPLYDVRSGKLAVPLSLSYHASGVRVGDIASWAGLGWSLNAGGVVTRVVRGLPDDAPGGYREHCRAVPRGANVQVFDSRGNFTAQYDTLSRIADGRWDFEPDLFTYNFSGQAGAFMQGNDGAFHSLPRRPLRITVGADSSITIVDEYGNTNFFNDKEFSSTSPRARKKHISAWYLSRMVSADKADTIYFDYRAASTSIYSLQQQASIVSTIAIFADTGDGGLDKNPQDAYTETSSTTHVSTKRLQRIRFKGGVVDLTTRAGRVDGGGDETLESVRVLSSDRQDTLKQVRLYHSYFNQSQVLPVEQLGNYWRLRLDSVAVANNRLREPPYVFSYNSTPLPSRVTGARDHWGYNNNGGQTPGGFPGTGSAWLIPVTTVQSLANKGPLVVGGVDREPHPGYVQAGLLTQIKYPTGGQHRFYYEPNAVPETYRVPNPPLVVVANATTPPTGDSTITNRQVFHITYPVAAQCDINAATAPPLPGHTNPPKNLASATLYDITVATAPALVFPSEFGQTIHKSLAVELKVGHTYALEAFARGLTSVTIKVSYTALAATYAQRNVLAGGVRLRAQYIQANPRGTATIKRYYYNAEGRSASSGYLINVVPPRYVREHVSRVDGRGNPICDPAVQICLQRSIVDIIYATVGSATLGELEGTDQAVGYRRVTVVDSATDGQAGGRTVSEYSTAEESGTNMKPYPGKILTSWDRGNLLRQYQYAARADGTLALVAKVVNQYATIPGVEIHGFKAAADASFSGAALYTANYPVFPFAYINTYQPSDWPYIAQTQRYTYAAGDTNAYHLAVTRYQYANPRHQQPTLVETELAGGTRQQTRLRYAADFDTSRVSGAPAGALRETLRNNAVAQVVEQITTRTTPADTLVVQGTLSLMRVVAPHVVVPAQQLTYRAARPQPLRAFHVAGLQGGALVHDPDYETRAVFDSYDEHRQLVQAHVVGSPPVSTLWDPLAEQPIAQVTAARYEQVAVTSFEPGATGRWRYDSTGTHRVPGGRTGRWAYRLDGRAGISRDGLPAGDYELSYWAQGTIAPQIAAGGGSLLTGGAQPVATAPDGWRQYRARLHLGTTGQVSLGVDPNGPAVLLDELRLYPLGAQLTSYTHDALRGVTSQTDPTGRTITYEYDGLGRLVRTRDEQGRILSQQQYHYAGQ